MSTAQLPAVRALAIILLMAAATTSAADRLNVDQFPPCTVWDQVDSFWDTTTAWAICLDETAVAVVVFACDETDRRLFVDAGTAAEQHVRVGYRIGKGEVQWGTWTVSDDFAFQRLKFQSINRSSDEAKHSAAEVIDEWEEAVAAGDRIAVEVGGWRTVIDFPADGGHADAIAEYRRRCASQSP